MKWVYRHISQQVCPWNVKFAQELKEPAFAPREVLAEKDARQLTRELLAMSQEEFSASSAGCAARWSGAPVSTHRFVYTARTGS